MKKIKINKCLFAIFSNITIVVMLVFLSAAIFLKDDKSVFKPTDDVYYLGNSKENNVSLMINVYWGSEFLEPMLKVLDEFNVKATFFVGGLWASKEPELLLKIFEKGHEIGNHGFYHKSHDKLTEKQNEAEILNNHKLIKEYLKIDMNLFAPPSGAYSQTTVNVAKKLGYKVVMWSKDTIDWRDQDKNLIIKRVSTNNQNGDLLLLHPTKSTLEALPTIIKNILSQNFKIVCVSQNISSDIV